MSTPPQMARHPKTGELIRIITTDASVWRDQKTLVWLDKEALAGAGAPTPSIWSRWDVGVTSLADYEAARTAGVQPDIVVALGDTASWDAWLATGAWSAPRILAVPKSLVTAIGMEKLLTYRINNMICLDEMTDLYPHTGPAWDGTAEDAKVLLALALHMGRTFPAAPSPDRAALAATRGLKLSSTLTSPPPLWLIGQYYVPDKSRRRKEIATCLRQNLENPLIDRVVLLNETACAPAHPKIQEEVLGSRLTYADVLRWIAANAPPEAIVAFANSDIFFDSESLRLLWSIDLRSKFLALLRWDVESAEPEAIAAAKLFGPRPDSQDTWIVSAASVREAFAGADLTPFQFPFGQGGCDNAITLEMLRKRFTVANPALTIKTYHLHSSAVRNYDPRDIVRKAAYLYVQPTGLHDMRPDLAAVPGQATQTLLRRTPFPRPITGPLTAAQARTFCTMVGRATGGAVTLDPTSANLWEPAAVPVARMTDVFQTPEGLTYGYDTIHVGRSKASQDAWGASQLSSMAASVSVDDAMVAPLPDAVAKDAGRFVLEYLAKVLVLGKTFETIRGEFWCAKSKECIEAIKAFSWPRQEVPVLSRDETHQTWCKSAAVWPYMDEPAGLVSQEEVAALRGALGLGGWVPQPEEGPKRLVIVVDGTTITDEAAEAMEAAVGKAAEVTVVWAGRTNLYAALGKLRGAWGFLAASTVDLVNWAWALPAGAVCWEVQSEMKPSAALLHQCAAAAIHHRLAITPKGSLTAADRDTLGRKLSQDILSVCRAMEPATQRPPPIRTPRPRLLMPTAKEGYFGHAGDSFREMARMWAERGYVNITEDPTLSQVWLGGVGKTLLYDRPNLNWLGAAPKAEQAYEIGLFGNPAPPAGAGWAWTFWPRRPQLVEAAVARGDAASPFEKRSDGLVFYGRSENAVQKGHRTKADWASVCDKFVHVEGADGKYPFTQEEYLQQLAGARYGLCLAGYGRKCHREVECMAMGCVPIVAEEVDMNSYAVPPLVGYHYFRVKNPEEAAHIVRSMPRARWEMMSAACRAWWANNASVDGAWDLTARLLGLDISPSA